MPHEDAEMPEATAGPVVKRPYADSETGTIPPNALPTKSIGRGVGPPPRKRLRISDDSGRNEQADAGTYIPRTLRTLLTLDR